MAFNNVISRTDEQALIPEEVAAGVISRVVQQSAALTMFRRIPVSRAQVRIPIVSALPTAYFVTGDTGLKQTTEVNWTNRYLNIEEIAAIVPIPEAVINDTAFDVWGEIQPLLAEAIGRTFDAAVFFGTNAPASYPVGINAAAAAAGNSFTEASLAAAGAFFGDLDAAIALLESDGYEPTGYVAAMSAKGRFRAARSTQGERLDENRLAPDLNMVDGSPIAYPMRGLFPTGGVAGTNVRLMAMEREQFIVGVRQDITYKLLDQAVIQDNTGAIVYNLAQQDMVAMRVVFRAGWQVSNVISYDQQIEANRFPAAVLRY